MTHQHGHERPLRALGWAFVSTSTFMVVEAAVGWWSGSLALLADAGHMLSDAGALALALAAQQLAARPRSMRGTYGFRRVEVLAAFANGVILAGVAAFILSQAWQRWSAPRPILAGPLLVTALVGLALNLVVARTLHAEREQSLNVRAALAHVLADTLGSIAAIASGVLILAFGWLRADALLSVAIATLVGWSSWRLVAQTIGVLLETVPPGVSLPELERLILETKGVRGLHDLHAWRITEGFDLVTVHVVLDGTRHGPEVASDVCQRIHERYGIEHVTCQPEVGPPDSLVQIVRR